MLTDEDRWLIGKKSSVIIGQYFFKILLLVWFNSSKDVYLKQLLKNKVHSLLPMWSKITCYPNNRALNRIISPWIRSKYFLPLNYYGYDCHLFFESISNGYDLNPMFVKIIEFYSNTSGIKRIHMFERIFNSLIQFISNLLQK